MFMTANPKMTDLQAKLFRGFSDPSRLAILESGDEIRIGPHTMIFDQTPVEAPAAT